MTSPLIERIIARLVKIGYIRMETPFTVASIRFEFDGAVRGRDGRSGDLVLLVDTSLAAAPDAFGDRVRQRIGALSRALDLAESPVVLTVILAGVALPPHVVASVAKTCRVLNVTDDPTLADDKNAELAWQTFDDRLRVLLPLTIAHDLSNAVNPLQALDTRLDEAGLSDEAKPFLAASGRGKAAVSAVLREELDQRLTQGLPE